MESSPLKSKLTPPRQASPLNRLHLKNGCTAVVDGILTKTGVPDTIEETGIDDSTSVQRIPLYRVIFLNDNVTTMDFVVYVLITLFKKDRTTAVSLMLEVHHQGSAVV